MTTCPPNIRGVRSTVACSVEVQTLKVSGFGVEAPSTCPINAHFVQKLSFSWCMTPFFLFFIALTPRVE